MVYLDTHVVLWLYEGVIDNLSKKAKELISNNPIWISPMVMLELQYLFEINRCSKRADDIFNELNDSVDLEICTALFTDITRKALSLHWTRDPFDRLIIANAMLNQKPLITKDKIMHKHYKLAVW